MSQRSLHQFLTGAAEGDAITGHALILRDWLREMGLDAQLFAQHIHPNVEHEVRHISRYKGGRDEKWAIYHHSIGSIVPDYLAQQPLQLFLIYHNITPVRFFERNDLMRVEEARLGRKQLQDLRQQTGLAVAVSAYNERELQEVGYTNTTVLPLPLDSERYDGPLNESLAAKIRKRGPNLLFVGRLAPNKKQEDLLKLLAYYRRIEPDAQLILVGDRWDVGYDTWIESLADELNLGQALTLTGKISQQDMVTYYKTADIFICMSEHEGFGLPLLESMYCSLPVLAYASTGVPGTMGDAGVQFLKKDYEALAELVHFLLENEALRQRIIARQKEHVRDYLAPAVQAHFQTLLQRAGIISSASGK